MFLSRWKWLLPALIPFAIGFPMANMNSWRPRRVRVAGRPFQVAFSPDGGRVALASQPVGSATGRIEWWNISPASRLRGPSTGDHRAFAVYNPSSICFSSDSQSLVCVSYGAVKTVNRWNVLTGQKASPLLSHNGDTAQQAHTAPGTGDIAYWTGQSVEQRDAKNGQVKKRTALFDSKGNGENDPYNKIAFAPDGQTTAWNLFNDNTGLVVTRDTANRKKRLPPVLKSSPQATCTITSLTFSPDSRFLVASWNADIINPNGNDAISSRVALWDLKTRTLIAKWTECSQPITAHAFSPDGSLLAAARIDGAISIRNARNGQLIRLLKTAGMGVSSVAFSPDGATLASCGSDGALYLWRVV